MISTLNSILAWILIIATILGGIAATHYFLDRWRKRGQLVEKEKEINSAWWESSELKNQYEAEGYKDFSWSNSDLVAKRVSEGKEIVYEIDQENGVKYRFLNKSGQVLLGRKVD